MSDVQKFPAPQAQWHANVLQFQVHLKLSRQRLNEPTVILRRIGLIKKGA